MKHKLKRAVHTYFTEAYSSFKQVHKSQINSTRSILFLDNHRLKISTLMEMPFFKIYKKRAKFSGSTSST